MIPRSSRHSGKPPPFALDVEHGDCLLPNRGEIPRVHIRAHAETGPGGVTTVEVHEETEPPLPVNHERIPPEEEALEKQRRPVVEGHVRGDPRQLGAEELEWVHKKV